MSRFGPVELSVLVAAILIIAFKFVLPRLKKTPTGRQKMRISGVICLAIALLIAGVLFAVNDRYWYESSETLENVFGFGGIAIGLLLLIGAALTIAGLEKPQSRSAESASADDALEVARRRLAAGEITPAQYDDIARRLG